MTLSSISVTPAHSTIVYNTRTTTIGYNRQCQNYIDTLGAKKARLQDKVNDKLATDPNYTGSRREGVSLAWEYEKPISKWEEEALIIGMNQNSKIFYPKELFVEHMGIIKKCS